MSDLIDRQAAISAICNACGKIDCDKMDKCEKLQLPPANCSEFPNNSDTISRQAAIDRIIGTGYADQIKENVIMILMGLPPAEPKRGHWKHVDPIPEKMLGWMPWYCSECGAGVGKHQTAYCPNCGADMRGEQDG